MNELEMQVFQNIERHLKNISISLRVIEERKQKSPNNLMSICKLKNHYDFDNIDLNYRGGPEDEYDRQFVRAYLGIDKGCPVSVPESKDLDTPTLVIPDEPKTHEPVQPHKSLWGRWWNYCYENSLSITWAVLTVYIASTAFVFICMGIVVLIWR